MAYREIHSAQPLLREWTADRHDFLWRPRNAEADPNKNSWATKVVSVVAEGDYVTVGVVRECADPRTAGKTYTTTWFDMWRFVDGKADEHWDFGTVAGQGNAPDCARVGGPAGAPPAGARGQRQ